MNIKGSSTQRIPVKEELKSEYDPCGTKDNFISNILHITISLIIDDLAPKMMSPMDQPQNLLISDKAMNSKQSLTKLNIVNVADAEMENSKNKNMINFPKIRSTSQL